MVSEAITLLEDQPACSIPGHHIHDNYIVKLPNFPHFSHGKRANYIVKAIKMSKAVCTLEYSHQKASASHAGHHSIRDQTSGKLALRFLDDRGVALPCLLTLRTPEQGT